MIRLVVKVLVGWVLVSIPVALLVGRWLREQTRPPYPDDPEMPPDPFDLRYRPSAPRVIPDRKLHRKKRNDMWE